MKLEEEKVVYSRPPGWSPTPKPRYHHVLSKAGLKVASKWTLDPEKFVEAVYRDD